MIFTRTLARPRLTSLLLAGSLGLGAIGSAQAATYYVRTDGGNASQCTGRGDAAYPGSGSARNCAWNNPNIALPPSGALRIAGGDTLLIGSGTYRIGSGGQMQPIPSGTTTTPTRVMGKSAATAPRLAGINGVHRVINMDGSSNVVLGNLEITDQSDCVYGHSKSAAACTSSMPWARVGLYARASRNVRLHDINIHGMAARGMQAGGLTDWTMDRLKLNKNGLAGWDGNVGSGGSNSGKIIMRDIEIAWNGCGERVSTGAPWACWAQQTGGYGDGLGTTTTGGQWLIEDAFIHHNTSDGLDLRYMDGADNTHVTLRRVHAVANAGNQVKVRGSSLIENSVLVGHCTYFKGKHYMVDGDHCRAYGSTVLLVLTGNDTAVLRHNTLAGEGDVLVGYTDGDSSDRIHIQNNAFVGFPYFRDTSVQTVFSGGKAPAAKSFTGNLGWNLRSCPSGNICGVNPRLTSMALSTFDAEQLSGSPLIDRAPMISAVTTDFLMGKRPTGAANDIGAYEFGAAATTTPPPVNAEAKPDDFNGDGIADILWRNLANGANTIWKSANSSLRQSTSGAALAWDVVGKGDFNGDGKSDILWRNSSNGNNSIWKSGNHTTSQAVTQVANRYWKVVGVGDFNADGKDDILWRNMLSGANTIWMSANASTQQPLSTVSSLDWKVVGVGDFNGDGKADILWRNTSTGANSIWLSGNSATGQGVARVRSQDWQVKGVGDFNGDGKSDVLWRNAATGANVIWRSGAYSTQQAMTYVTDGAWHIVAVADYNGDGKDDILWRHQINGKNVIWLSAKRANSRNIGAVTNRSWTVM